MEDASREILEKLLLVPGIPGYEDLVREEIKKLVGGAGRLWEDRVGNLVLELGGEGPRILVAAHMDELGLVVTGIDSNGLLSFRKLGGIDDSILPGTHVIVHTSKGPIEGVIGVEPPHLRMVRENADKPKPWHQLRIDIGAESREEAEEMGVRVLDQVTFKKLISYPGRGKMISARGLDDRAGCATLVELARDIAEGKVRPRAEVILAWTVQEEVGLRGARALAARLQPDYFIAVDTMTCCHPAITGSLAPGKGPVLRAIDNAHIAPPRLVRKIEGIAREKGMPVQLATAGGGTDAAAFQLVGVPSIGISVPMKYTHSLVETVHLGDYALWRRLLAAILEAGLP